MADHLNRFRELANQVESLSGKVKGMEENKLVTLLSLNLPEFYQPIIMALQSRTQGLTFDSFASRLLQESARREVAHIPHPGQGQMNTPTAVWAAKYATRG